MDLLVMPKYWGKQIFTHARFPEVGQKQKTERKREKKKDDGNNNGQAMHGAPKHAWRTQAAWAKKVKFLDIYLDLEKEEYGHFRKPGDTPIYVGSESNHPKKVL